MLLPSLQPLPSIRLLPRLALITGWALALLPAFALAADLRVANVFSANAVLQQGQTLPIWGTAPAGQEVTVKFAGQTETTRARENGNWRVELAPLEADSSGRSMVVSSTAQLVEIHNLLVGEVWYATGQSNMQMTLGACVRKNSAIRSLLESEPQRHVRLLRINDPDSPLPQPETPKVVAWQIDSPANRNGQSAVAWFFARRLHETLGVPVGIIEGSWGGKPIEGFIPRTQFEQRDALRPILVLADADKLSELASLRGGVVIRNTAGRPGRIFNARIAPIAPYGLRGFIWYQGESNAGRGEDPRNYRTKMRALVDGLRASWSEAELPFYFVQLPSFNEQATGWIRLREEQRLSLAIKHTGMAVTIDLRDNDIHPANKLDVGERLARWALAKTYGKDIPFSGPLYRSAIGEGSSMRVEFAHASGGLMIARKDGIAEPTPSPDAALSHFEIADASGRWYPAQATIVGSAVQVHCPLVATPRAVRYACSGAPTDANLYNQAGLPASPFCSDLELLPWQDAQ